MFNATQSHDTFPLRCTPTERFQRLVGRVHVWVKRGLSTRLLGTGLRCGVWLGSQR